MFLRFIILGKLEGFYNILFHLSTYEGIKIIVFEFLPSWWVNVKIGWLIPRTVSSEIISRSWLTHSTLIPGKEAWLGHQCLGPVSVL